MTGETEKYDLPIRAHHVMPLFPSRQGNLWSLCSSHFAPSVHDLVLEYASHAIATSNKTLANSSSSRLRKVRGSTPSITCLLVYPSSEHLLKASRNFVTQVQDAFPSSDRVPPGEKAETAPLSLWECCN